MSKQPNLETPRLTLRPFSLADVPAVTRLAGEKEIAANTLSIPHPYPDDAAEKWISTHEESYDAGTLACFAIAERGSNALVGATGLVIKPDHDRAELGYWIGKPYWGRGYCTEASAALVGWGFNERGLHRIHASHFARNPASGRVMEKLGMTREGLLRGHIKKWGQFEDLVTYGILGSEFRAGQ